MSDNLPYTVVGYYPETDETYVEWVEAEDVMCAITASVAIDEARMEAVTVSVFEGHMVDKWTNKGRATEETNDNGECSAWHCPSRESDTWRACYCDMKKEHGGNHKCSQHSHLWARGVNDADSE